MSFVNQTKETATMPKDSHLNYMGGTSYDIKNPIHNLRLAASSCFFGEPMYYQPEEKKSRSRHMGSISHMDTAKLSRLGQSELNVLRETLNAIDPKEWRSMTPAQLLESAIDKALDYDIEATLQEAVRLRNEDHIRTTPQVILVRAANHPKIKGTGLLKKYVNDIVKRADEPAVCIAYHLERMTDGSRKNKKIPNGLKKALAQVLKTFKEYNFAKYKMENRKVKTVDVIRLVHPGSSPIFDKLYKGELKTTGETWESIISEKGSNNKSWTEAVDVMGHMALLRNLRNLAQNHVDTKLYMNKLIEGVDKGQQLPFRYYSAYNALTESGVASGNVLDAIEICMQKSLVNLPKFSGKVMSLCDNSGSAHGTTTSSMGTMKVSSIANLSAVITGMVSDEGYIGVFGDNLEVLPVRKTASIFDQTKKADLVGSRIGHGTENGIWLFWDNAIKNKEHWDHVFIYSDMQAGHGGLYGLSESSYRDYRWFGSRNIDVPKLISVYRRTVNPNVKVYCVQVAGYQDTIIPEYYDKTYILGGWGDGVLRFAKYLDDLTSGKIGNKVTEENVTPVTTPVTKKKVAKKSVAKKTSVKKTTTKKSVAKKTSTKKSVKKATKSYAKKRTTKK